VGAERGGVAPRFFFDRNLGKRVPEALAADGWLVEKHDDHFGPETTDIELFQEVSQRDWVFVTQDKKIRSRAAERRALVAHGLRTFSVASTANLSAEDTIRVLKKAKPRIDATLASDLGPFVYGVRKDGSVHRFAF
jgi:predicted nuclease of predicted toxin-antitoxin system